MASRYERFLAAKDQAGGFDNLQRTKAKFWVHFKDTGEIVGLGTEPIARSDWLSYQFTEEQVRPLQSGNWLEYEVYIDPEVDNLYSIQKKPEEKLHVDSDTHDLQLIECGSGGDVHLTVARESVTVALGASALVRYRGVEPAAAQARGKKALTFYTTLQPDPHYYHGEFTVSLEELIAGPVTVEIDIGQCSVFTQKLFDNYTRT